MFIDVRATGRPAVDVTHDSLSDEMIDDVYSSAAGGGADSSTERSSTDSRTSEALVDFGVMGAPIDAVTRDVDSAGMIDGTIDDEFHAERRVHTTSAAGGGADGAEGAPPAAAADGFVSIGVDIGAGCDGYEAEQT